MRFPCRLWARLFLVTFFYVGIFGEVRESEEKDNETYFSKLGDQRARQSRPSSLVADIVPSYSVEYRSLNVKDVKFNSESKLYQANVPENTSPGTKVKCDLKMGVYAPEERKVQFDITGGNDNSAFTVSSRRLKDFVFMDIKLSLIHI